MRRNEITVCCGKGKKDRRTVLPGTVQSKLKRQIQSTRIAHEMALADGYAGVDLPKGLARKYPRADQEWIWQYLFPAPKPSRDPRSGAYRRHHLHPSGVRSACPDRGTESWSEQACHTPYLPAQLCYSLAGRWLRHPHCSRIIGARRGEDHHDLHPRAKQRRKGSEKPS